MDALRLAIRQPVTVAVGVILVLIAGVLALTRLPVQLTPNVDDTVVSVTTMWEGASPKEIEQEIVDKQEEKLQGISGLSAITSSSVQGEGSVRLEFQTGTPKEVALREVSDKLREVEDYPDNAEEPVISDSDPENRDYIAWIVFGAENEAHDVRLLQDFAEDRIKTRLEQVAGISEINVLGGRERETQVRYDPTLLAQRGITPTQFVTALQQTNRDVSAGEIDDASSAVRVRTLSQYETPDDVRTTVIGYDADGGPIFASDVADVVETHKELLSFVRWQGQPVLAINAQREVGSNVIEVMDGLKAALAELTQPGGVLDAQSERLGYEAGTLFLEQVYDQTVYIDQALALVQSNIFIGGGIAIAILMLFLWSPRAVTIIAVAIPISVIGAVVAMSALGRTVNVISLAGMAFAVGMVVDNAIVVLENIYRHLEMGKKPMQAAYDGSREVFGALVASTLTTVVVFIPILLIEEEAGQLFRDIALAVCAAVLLSLVVSVTVIPAAAARLMRAKKAPASDSDASKRPGPFTRLRSALQSVFSFVPRAISNIVYKLSGSWIARIAIVAIMTVGALIGTQVLRPPSDYLPAGNRNLVFGILIPPPGYTIDKQSEFGERIEATVREYWEAGDIEPGTEARARAEAELSETTSWGWDPAAGLPVPSDPVQPPPIENYFFVATPATMFHGAISADDRRVLDIQDLLTNATAQEVLPGTLAFAFQLPLFRTGGTTGSAVKIELIGDDLDQLSAGAGALMGELIGRFGPLAVQPSPSNFGVGTPEMQVRPDRVRLAELGQAVQSFGDGAIIGEYRVGGETIDLKVIDGDAVNRKTLAGLQDTPIATASGLITRLADVARISQVQTPQQINRVDRQRAITLELSAPQGVALETAIADARGIVDGLREAGVIAPTIRVAFSGSASKLNNVQNALIGDGTLAGTLGSALFLSLTVVYLLMCVLFQSFVKPIVILVSVPPATLGGFAALFGVFIWSAIDRYQPMQQLDVLTMLGFVLLIGVVVNNAILIVHQALNFMAGKADSDAASGEAMPPRRAIAESVRTRVRPILMGTMTSVGGMLPLVIAPGSGSELYRGLGSVVVGGLLLSTVFTLFLVPLLLSLVLDIQAALG
ncbi:MAG: efflux RND transporter permease subunit, partial [Planctomycetota bacterium]